MAATLDLSRPVAVMLIAVLHFFDDASGPKDFIDMPMAALPPGSYLAMSHGTHDFMDPEVAATRVRDYKAAGITARARTTAEVTALFDRLTVIRPGVVPVSQWRAEHESQPPPTPDQAALNGGVASKS